jgi:hypothetical protein
VSDWSHAAGDSVAVTTLVPESCTTCGGDSVNEQGGALGDAPAGTIPTKHNATAAKRTRADRIILGW